MRSVVAACLLALVVSTAASATVQDSLAPEVVELRFAWPPDLHARVEATRYQFRTLAGSTDSTIALLQCDMVTEPHEAGLLVRSVNFDVIGEPVGTGGPSMQVIAEQMQGLVPGLIVSPSGELVGLDDVSGLQATIRTLLQPLLDSLPPGARPQFTQLLETFTSSEYLLAKTAEDWNAIVGIWVGADFELGAVYEAESEEPSPILPDRMIPFTYEFIALERVPCTEGESDSACVMLEMVSYPDQNVMASLLETFLDQVTSGMPAPDMWYEELAVENWIQLVTEPATLVPHFVAVVQTMEGTIRVRGEQPAEFVQTRGREYHYIYSDQRR